MVLYKADYVRSFRSVANINSGCSVENNVSCHFHREVSRGERTEGESRNLLLVDFSTSPPFLSSPASASLDASRGSRTEDTGAPVEMTVSLFYKANSGKIWWKFTIKYDNFWDIMVYLPPLTVLKSWTQELWRGLGQVGNRSFWGFDSSRSHC